MRIRLLGGFEVLSPEDRPVRFATRRTALLFASLVLAGPRGLRREVVSEALWSGRDPTQGRNSLRQALVDVRRHFPSGPGAAISIEGDQDTIGLVVDAEQVDLWSFRRKCDDGGLPALASAANLFRGDLLAGVAFPGGIEEWFAPHRQDFRSRAQRVVEQLSIIPVPANSPEEVACEQLAERLLAIDPVAEEAHRGLIRVYLRRGHENKALRQFETCKAALALELQAEPEAMTNALIASLRSGGRVAPPHSISGLGSEHAGTLPPEERSRGQPSLVVMPFDNLGSDDDEYFADGVVEEVTASLSRVRDFFVIARQSAFTYKGRFVDAREIGQELGVTYAVEGTVRRAGERLRISVQLVDTETGQQLWSDRYEGASSDVFGFQDHIAGQVAGAIHPAIRGAEIDWQRRHPPASLRAYDLLMRAFPKLWGENAHAIDEAMKLLREALEIDPGYGRAHAFLAWCHGLNIVYLWAKEPDVELARARDIAAQAAGLVQDDPTGLTACGAALSLTGDQRGATTLLSQALALDPNNAWAWNRFGWVGIYSGDAAAARLRFERAMELSPLDPFIFNMRMGIAAAHVLAGNLDDAVAIARDVVTRNPAVTWAYRQLTAWAAMNGDMPTAMIAAQRFLTSHPDFTIAKYLALPIFNEVPAFRDAMANGLRAAGVPET